ncbi:peptidoglycan DD-metalloendopeptidase family protein, partial [Candidatus Parcubacteria bacterium]|nr:peptidoglycan DD-metalloendopeptidase family protein [Candidatus Parcubacteria bacterium]
MKPARSLIPFLILALLAPFAVRGATSAALSQQIDEVKRQRDALVAEQERLQAELDKVSQEGQTLGTAVKSLDTTRKKLAADIRVTQSKIASTDLNIKLLENNVSAAERQIAAHRKAIGEALQKLSQADASPLALHLLASASFSDIWRDTSELSSLSASLDGEVGSLRETKSALVKQKVEKEKVKEEILSLNQELTGQKQVVEEARSAKEKLLAETKSKEALYQELLAENRAREKQFEDDLYRLESELNLSIDPSLIPVPRHNVLSWPLDNIFITTYFGKVSGSALRIYASGSHNGVDFRATQGTPVKAVLAGTIKGIGNTDEERGCGSYGRWILIEHGNGLSTVYAHLSASLV